MAGVCDGLCAAGAGGFLTAVCGGLPAAGAGGFLATVCGGLPAAGAEGFVAGADRDGAAVSGDFLAAVPGDVVEAAGRLEPSPAFVPAAAGRFAAAAGLRFAAGRVF